MLCFSLYRYKVRNREWRMPVIRISKGTREVQGSLSKEPANFIEHLLAMPDVGEDSDFDRPRTGPRLPCHRTRTRGECGRRLRDRTAHGQRLLHGRL